MKYSYKRLYIIRSNTLGKMLCQMKCHRSGVFFVNFEPMEWNLWNNYRDEPTNPLSSISESFKYKTSITGNTYNVGAGEEGYDANKVGKNETEVVIPLKYLSNF